MWNHLDSNTECENEVLVHFFSISQTMQYFESVSVGKSDNIQQARRRQEVMTRYDSMVMCRNVLEMGVTMPLHGEIAQPPSARRKCSPGRRRCCCSTV